MRYCKARITVRLVSSLQQTECVSSSSSAKMHKIQSRINKRNIEGESDYSSLSLA
ncbi:Uncharacterised protein [Vibrio cholerae]|nr:Uncharacterised protein [Vibrio cholerae]